MTTTTTTTDPRTDEDLARRLLELINQREGIAGDHAKAVEAAEIAAQSLGEIDEEIVSIKRALGFSARGSKGSRPTRAGTSPRLSTLAGLKEPLARLMSDRQWRQPAAVLKGLGITDHAQKQSLRQYMSRQCQAGVFERKKAGELNTGSPHYAYRLKTSTG